MSDYSATGTVTFTDELNGTTKTLGTAAIVAGDYDAIATLSVRIAGAGTHTITASYSGDDTYGSNGDASMTIEVTDDTSVAASGVGVSYSTFYPYKDSYRDTVAIRGTLLEPASVAIRVYSSANRVVRSFSVSTRTGAYSVAWNGRTSGGTLLAAGRYRVVQTIRDAVGHTRAFTAYTTLSNKRLYWYTKSITKYGASYSYYDESSFGWVLASNKYYRGVNIYGNIYDEYAWVGYNFTLPSATAYGTLTFKVLGTPWSGRGVPYLSFWNFANGEEDGNRWVGRSYAWYGTSVSSSGHMTASHGVRAYVTVVGTNEGWYDLAKVQLTYRYGVLR
jgi:hypothetical protein